MRGDQLPLLRTRVPGPRSRTLARQLHLVESRNVTAISDQWPIFWKRAAGANVWDVDGNRYIDLSGAFGVAGVGHTNPRVVAALATQAKQLLHAMGDVHPNELKLRLARALIGLTFGRWSRSPARVVFGNSGAEAVEVALKTANIFTHRPGVIAFEGAYHGLTYGALDATWRLDFRLPFDNQLGHFTTHLPLGVLPLVGRAVPARRKIRRGDGRMGRWSLPKPISHYGAVLVEPIQGRGGIVVPPDGFLPQLRRFCDAHGLVLIFDEIYSGFGRTGRWFACEHWDVVPDIVCVGKALAGGLPLSACIGRAEVMDCWPESRGEAIHTSTFLGHPLGCAAALAAIAEMKRLRLASRSERLGQWLSSRLAKLSPVRGKGLMLGLDVGDAARLCERLLRCGIIAIPEGNHGEVLGITPPLVVAERQLDYSVEVLARLLR